MLVSQRMSWIAECYFVTSLRVKLSIYTADVSEAENGSQWRLSLCRMFIHRIQRGNNGDSLLFGFGMFERTSFAFCPSFDV